MAKKFRIHILGVPHTRTTREFCACAFTQKVWKFLKMMSGRGHELFHYGHETRDWDYPDCEAITVTTDADLLKSYGAEYMAGAWQTRGFAPYYQITDLAHTTFHANSIKAINARKQPGDIVLHFWGWGTKAVADAIPDLIHIEPGIGYSSAWSNWRIYESHSVMNAIAGASAVQYCQQRWYHRVIPNYFDPDDFVYTQVKDDYILYLGRIGTHKGVDIAIDACQRANKRLIIAGQGSLRDMGYATTPTHVVEVGYADADRRQLLLSRAAGLIISSMYLEPFAGVQVEAWLSGTPVISPDWAAFAEMNQHGVTGFRCHNMREFVQACRLIGTLNPADCRRAGERYLLSRVAKEYENYFEDVLDVYTGAGWYEMRTA